MSKTFCAYPWHHIYVATTGHLKLCCLSNEHIAADDRYHLFNLVKDSLDDCWNSSYMRDVRQKMLNGQRLPSCSRCYDLEDKGFKSMRDTSNFEEYKNATQNGFYNKPMNHIELHFGNVCNLACKMCSQQYSHKVGQELIDMSKNDTNFMTWLQEQGGVVNNWTTELGKIYDWFKEIETKNKIFEYVSKNVENMSIVGGEPTAIKEFYELLEFCKNEGTLKNKSIVLTTNLTNTNPNLIRWLNEAKSFTIYGSIDGIGDRNDYIRYPSRWHDIEKSLDFYKDLVKVNLNSKIVFGPTFQSLNIDHLIDMIEYFETFGRDYQDKFDVWWTSIVTAPRICDYKVLPDSYKTSIANDLEKNLIRLRNKNFTQQVQSHINSLRQKNDETLLFKKNILESFIKYNDKQDAFRKKTSWRKLLPFLEREINLFLKNV
jgi:organic radical activating enzyme